MTPAKYRGSTLALLLGGVASSLTLLNVASAQPGAAAFSPSFTPHPLLFETQPYSGNVRDWGAQGDGTTDDTAEIQDAIDNSSPSLGGYRAIYFPPGKYFISSPLDLHNYTNIRLYGEGDASVIYHDPSAGNPFNMVVANAATNIAVELLHFDGVLQTEDVTVGSSDGLQFTSCHNVTVRRCTFEGLRLTGSRSASGIRP